MKQLESKVEKASLVSFAINMSIGCEQKISLQKAGKYKKISSSSSYRRNNFHFTEHRTAVFKLIT
jgi:hypothetical protein